MILQALNDLAEREQLIQDPDYELKPISWVLQVSHDGKKFNIIDIRQQSVIPAKSNKKSKLVGKNLLVPLEKARTSGDRAFFFFDKSEYFFGKDPDGEQSIDKLQSRFQLFRQKVKECAMTTQDEAAIAADILFDDIAAGCHSINLPEDVKSNDLFIISYEPNFPAPITNRTAIKKYWKSIREKANSTDEQHYCLVSGDTFYGEVTNFPPTKKVPGGSQSGIALVSFNKNAFESYGWKGNENAAISRKSSEACAKALYRLVNPEPSRDDGSKLSKRNIRIGNDTLVCFWSNQSNDNGYCDLFLKLMEPDPAEVGEVYSSIWQGDAPAPVDEAAFYVLIISGQQGRIIMRDWIESTIARTQKNLARYFEDLSIVRNTHMPKEKPLPLYLPLNLIMRALSIRGENESIPEQYIARLIRAALDGTVFPPAMLQLAIERERAEITGADWNSKYRHDARAALIKAILNRKKRLHQSTSNYEEVKPDMDPNIASEGYILGKTMAVLERLQQLAQPGINATIVDRYFGSASSSPKSTFVRLLKNARYHVRKAQDDSSSTGTVILLDRLLDALINPFDPNKNGFPSYLDLNQQGLFILGYHQMRNWLWLSSDERERWEKAHPDAPAAYLWRTGKAQKKITEN